MIENNKGKYAPIVLFAFNRLEPLKACVSSLLRNSEVAETDLIVFVDGPRANKEGESEKVETVRKFVVTPIVILAKLYGASDALAKRMEYRMEKIQFFINLSAAIILLTIGIVLFFT